MEKASVDKPQVTALLATIGHITLTGIKGYSDAEFFQKGTNKWGVTFTSISPKLQEIIEGLAGGNRNPLPEVNVVVGNILSRATNGIIIDEYGRSNALGLLGYVAQIILAQNVQKGRPLVNPTWEADRPDRVKNPLQTTDWVVGHIADAHGVLCPVEWSQSSTGWDIGVSSVTTLSQVNFIVYLST